jgi:hypothetical protein
MVERRLENCAKDYENNGNNQIGKTCSSQSIVASDMRTMPLNSCRGKVNKAKKTIYK